jgi:thiol-disulfide isomerase/thioredoxin
MLERLLLALALVLTGIAAYTIFRFWHLRRAGRAVVAAGKPVLLYFRSDACAPCVAQARYVDQLRVQFGDRILIEKVDADVEQAKAERYGVFTLPTTLIVDAAGHVKHANYGLADTRKLTNQLLAVEPGRS